MRDLVYRVGVRIVAALMQATSLVLLARLLGANTFGLFTVWYSVALLVCATLGFGASARVLRLSAPDEPIYLRASLATTRLISVAIVLAVMAAIGSILGAPALLLASATILAVGEFTSEFMQALYAGASRQTASLGIIALSRLTTLSAVVAAGATLAAPLIAVLIASSALSLLMLTLIGAKAVGTRRLAYVMQTSRGFWFASMVGNLRNVEPPLLASVATPAVAGGFATVSRLTNPLLIVTSSMQAVFLPPLSAAAENVLEFRRQFRKLMLVGSAYGLTLMTLSPLGAWLLITTLGPDYEFLLPVAIGVIAATGFSSISNVYQIGLYALGKPSPVGWIVGLTSLAGLPVLAIVGSVAEASFWLGAVPIGVQVAQLVASRAVFKRLEG